MTNVEVKVEDGLNSQDNGYVNLTNTTLTPDQQDLLNMGLNCHYMTKPKPHRKRLEMEILLDDIHQLEKNGKITTSTALQPTLLAEAAKTRGVYHSKLLSMFCPRVSGRRKDTTPANSDATPNNRDGAHATFSPCKYIASIVIRVVGETQLIPPFHPAATDSVFSSLPAVINLPKPSTSKPRAPQPARPAFQPRRPSQPARQPRTTYPTPPQQPPRFHQRGQQPFRGRSQGSKPYSKPKPFSSHPAQKDRST
ncbi:hypothetical protein Pcinc_003881 [Petrolisthes cinctipes]|uniref:Uncharacterized protein n=1 Tax=Petrolisthes cinctipes TaxID=88211 RepID=A0AAE1GGG0_PETCI|nr:hypothetical protein Pcinc_003881 [Petrolisthes cinctipes]